MRMTLLLLVALALPASAAEDLSKYLVPAEKNPARTDATYAAAVYGIVLMTERLGDGQLEALAERVGVSERDARRMVRYGERYAKVMERDKKSEAGGQRQEFCRAFNSSGAVDVVALQDVNTKDAMRRWERDKKLYDGLIDDLSAEGREAVEKTLKRTRLQRKPMDVDWVAYARDNPEKIDAIMRDRCKDA